MSFPKLPRVPRGGIPRLHYSDSGKLNEADFENIWLRTKDRSLKLVVTLVGAVGLSGFAAGYQLAKTTLDSHVEEHLQRYLKGDAFKGMVGDALATGTIELRSERLASEKVIHDLQQRAEALNEAGVHVEDNLVSLTGQDGKSFRLERGIVSRDGKVQFAKPFPRPPIVLVDASFDDTMAHLRMQSQRTKITGQSPAPGFTVVSATEKGFTLSARYIRPNVSWIAIGW